MEIYIKNMVCNRCIMVVSDIFKQEGLEDANVKLGEVKVKEDLKEDQLEAIEKKLNQAGFELMNDARTRLIEEIKKSAIEFVYHDTESQKLNFSEYLAGKLHHDYNYLSSLFSSIAGTTIEKYLINLKIERVKELLVYDEKSLSEIAFELGYSSTAHLSGQFKKVTGFTPSYFKRLGEKKRKTIDQV